MKSPPPLVSRVDHLTIRIDDARYDQLFAAFAMTLGFAEAAFRGGVLRAAAFAGFAATKSSKRFTHFLSWASVR